MRHRSVVIIALVTIVFSIYALVYVDLEAIFWIPDDPQGQLTESEQEFVIDNDLTQKERDPAWMKDPQNLQTYVDRKEAEHLRLETIKQQRRNNAKANRERMASISRLGLTGLVAIGLGAICYVLISSGSATSVTRGARAATPKLLLTAGPMLAVLGCGILFSKRFAFPWSENYFSESDKAFYGTGLLVIGVGLFTPGLLSLRQIRSTGKQ